MADMHLLPGKPDLDFANNVSVGVGIILLPKTGGICLQERDEFAPRSPGLIANWSGGADEGDDTDADATALRELDEELGIEANADELIFLGAHRTLLPDGFAQSYRYAMKIDMHRMTKCDEGIGPKFFKNVQQALAEPLLHRPGTQWSLLECRKRGLVL